MHPHAVSERTAPSTKTPSNDPGTAKTAPVQGGVVQSLAQFVQDMKKSPDGLDNKIWVFSDLLQQGQNADDLREILSGFTPQELGTNAEFLFLATARIVDAAWDTPEAMDLVKHCLDAAAHLPDANDREDLWLELADKLAAIPEEAATRLWNIMDKQSAQMPSAVKAHVEAAGEALSSTLRRMDLAATLMRHTAAAQCMPTENAYAYMTRQLLPLIENTKSVHELETLMSHLTPELLNGSAELCVALQEQKEKILS